MPRINPSDYIGEKYGHFTLLEYAGISNDKRTQFLCECDCGTTKVVELKRLKSGNTQSCGCLKRTAATKVGEANKTHGLKNHRIYNIHHAMKSRCYNSNTESYPSYGGKGIGICDEWRDNVEAFYQWSMDNGYQDDLSIDRIGNDKDYSPDNCRWVTIEAQNRNKTTNHWITLFSETKLLVDWLKDERTVGETTYYKRLNSGLTPEEALTK